MIYPKSWEDVTIAQYIELNSIDVNQYESPSAIQLEKLCILTDSDSNDDFWDEMDIRKMNKVINNLNFLSTTPNSNVNKFILNDTLTTIDFNTLTIGEYIDLDYFITNNPYENIHKIVAILTRKTKLNEWGTTIFEPYSFDFKERYELIMNQCTLDEVYGIVISFIDWRQNFINTYQNIFQPNFADDYDDSEELSEEELQELKEIEEDETKNRKWGWERLLLSVANNEIIKSKEVLNLGLIYTFNLLSMKKDLNL